MPIYVCNSHFLYIMKCNFISDFHLTVVSVLFSDFVPMLIKYLTAEYNSLVHFKHFNI